ncbi:MAG: helix-turn-helix transcriptional regulator [Actinomycetota bacterium]
MSIGGNVIREARLRAGLTQAELAYRLRTRQPVIATWERGTRSPSFDTVVRAVRSCGLELGFTFYNYDHDDDIAIEETLKLEPEERIDHLLRSLEVQELLHSARIVDHD